MPAKPPSGKKPNPPPEPPPQKAIPKIPDFGICRGPVWDRVTAQYLPMFHSGQLSETLFVERVEYIRRQWCALHGAGNVSVFEHRKWLIGKLWKPELYEMNVWSDVRLRSICENNVVIWMGPGGCVAGDTRLLNPVTGESPTVIELFDRGEETTVMTLFGPRKAGVPFVKGVEELLVFQMENGHKITVSPRHRFLTPSGYRRACDLRNGDVLAAYVPSHPQSNLEPDLSARAQDDRGFQKTTEDYQDDCSNHLRPYGEPLHFSVGSAQSFFPLQVGAQGYSVCASDDSGGWDNKPPGTHLSSGEHPPSIGDSSSLSYNSETRGSLHSFSERQEPCSSSICQSHELLQTGLLPHLTSLEQDRDSLHTDLFCSPEHRQQIYASYGVSVSESRVSSITKTHPRVYFDLTVPGASHYFAEGTIHHNSGKTMDSAAAALEYWLEMPGKTAVIVCSTTKEMLRKRIWGSICELWHKLPDWISYKGVLTDTNCMIRWTDNDLKNGIFGVAVADGPVEEAINNLRGIHTTRVLWILDEMQGVKEAIMGVRPNAAKNPVSKFLGMGNPTHFMSMLCKYATPLGGWESVVRGETESWPIDTGPYSGTGRGYFFDGRKSPACLDPVFAKKNPWMINREQIDAHIRSAGEDSAEVWTDSIGWPPPVGTDKTVLDVQVIERFKCKEPAKWTTSFKDGWALDPAFAEGGDKKMFQIFRYGHVSDQYGARWVMEMREAMEIPIKTGEAEDPVEYQIVKFVKEYCEPRGIQSQSGGLDSTGIGRGLKSVFEKEWGLVIGVEFGGSASDMIVDASGKVGKDVFDRRSSELNIMVRRFAMAHGLRGLPDEAASQFSQRLMSQPGKYVVENKKLFKKRLGFSPDDADVVAIACEIARQGGAVPGDFVSVQSTPAQEEALQKSDDYFNTDAPAEHDWAAEANEYGGLTNAGYW